MPESTETLFENWLKAGQELFEAKKGSDREEALEQRLKSIEDRLEARGVDTDDLDDDRIEKWLQRAGGELDDAYAGHDHDDGSDSEKEDDEQVEDEQPDLPRQRVSKRFPKIHSGDDEDDVVRYLDESGKQRTRPGAKRGVPYEFDVETISDEQDETEDAA